MGATDPHFSELAEEFGQALDDWSEAVFTAIRSKNRSQSWLAAKLNVPEGKVSGWMQGREQLRSRGAALPGAGTTLTIVGHLGLEGESAARLIQLGDRIDHLQRQLTSRSRAWRKQTSQHLFDAPALADPPAEHSPASGEPIETGPLSAQGAASTEPGIPPTPHATTAGTTRHQRVPRRWSALTKKEKAAALAVPVAIIAGLVVTATRSGDATHQSRSAVPPAASESAGPQTAETPSGNPALAERPGIEKGTLGEDSRCSAPYQGPDAITWRVCARVEADKISFAFKVTNHGVADSKLKIQMDYAQAGGGFQPCPGARTAHVIKVPAGTTTTTPQSDCLTRRLPAPQAYQARGFVVAENATDASYRMAPTANVYPDRPTTWNPDVIG